MSETNQLRLIVEVGGGNAAYRSHIAAAVEVFKNFPDNIHQCRLPVAASSNQEKGFV